MNNIKYASRKDFRSDDELYFSWWLDELKYFGFIHSWEYESETFTLAEPHKLKYLKKMKTKSKEMEHKFLEKCEYTPDFKIFWNNKSKDIFYYDCFEKYISDPKELPYFCAKDNVSRIEIKPSFNFQGKTDQAIIKIKWLMQLGTPVQLVVPTPSVSKVGKISPKNSLFPNTFLPERYMFTDTGKQYRKIKYDFVTLKEYLNGNT